MDWSYGCFVMEGNDTNGIQYCLDAYNSKNKTTGNGRIYSTLINDEK